MDTLRAYLFFWWFIFFIFYFLFLWWFLFVIFIYNFSCIFTCNFFFYSIMLSYYRFQLRLMKEISYLNATYNTTFFSLRNTIQVKGVLYDNYHVTLLIPIKHSIHQMYNYYPFSKPVVYINGTEMWCILNRMIQSPFCNNTFHARLQQTLKVHYGSCSNRIRWCKNMTRTPNHSTCSHTARITCLCCMSAWHPAKKLTDVMAEVESVICLHHQFMKYTISTRLEWAKNIPRGLISQWS